MEKLPLTEGYYFNKPSIEGAAGIAADISLPDGVPESHDRIGERVECEQIERRLESSCLYL